jgi:hypothetical protein
MLSFGCWERRRLGFSRLLLAMVSPRFLLASPPWVGSIPAAFHAYHRFRFSSAVRSLLPMGRHASRSFRRGAIGSPQRLPGIDGGDRAHEVGITRRGARPGRGERGGPGGRGGRRLIERRPGSRRLARGPPREPDDRSTQTKRSPPMARGGLSLASLEAYEPILAPPTPWPRAPVPYTFTGPM